MNINEAGGFAFPFRDRFREAVDGNVNPGMTLLDYFAAAALSGLLTQWGRHRDLQGDMAMKSAYPCFSASQRKTLADRAYEIARAMIDARVESYLDQADVEK